MVLFLYLSCIHILLVSEKNLSATASGPISLTPSNRKSQLRLVIYFLHLSFIHIYCLLKKFGVHPLTLFLKSEITTPPVPM